MPAEQRRSGSCNQLQARRQQVRKSCACCLFFSLDLCGLGNDIARRNGSRCSGHMGQIEDIIQEILVFSMYNRKSIGEVRNEKRDKGCLP